MYLRIGRASTQHARRLILLYPVPLLITGMLIGHIYDLSHLEVFEDTLYIERCQHVDFITYSDIERCQHVDFITYSDIDYIGARGDLNTDLINRNGSLHTNALTTS